MKRAGLFALPMALLVAREAHGQVRFRSELGAQLEPTRRLSINVSERAVFGDRIADSGRWQTLVGVSYEPRRWLTLGVGYRLTGEAEFSGPAFRHRVLAEATLSKRFGAFRLAYRLRGQEMLDASDATLNADFYLRNRVGVRWRSPWSIDLATTAEVFSDLSGQTTNAFDRLRVEAGVTWHVSVFELQGAYRYDTPWQGGGQPYHMAMVSFTWHWARRPSVRRRDGR